ncbi:D-alanyl-D-alanine carboxypeptidase/D-alanyl-D-alanine-endopeptidase [Nocardioides sp. CFH 31398]|uniref:D-alanyl-D-alanine carboxypeptidase/D-alanyl-D-alanine endopeptidase n=1 Tax=Nocardioides sp. CFH 31398 TaxID=2919579 RepID=UPI001F053B3E|nr:D-alanyl-D-alanine carboxypeptidase/D-alanyl-D-alanine-endopeptidase [Nocardioides sp. CFH 31398]MCH1866149.1 D-alanyl-D-alanine carboxypeptidase/D-alanyl-D-alanine-endopeptidase [Nocardioides sp. CFH 31398]
MPAQRSPRRSVRPPGPRTGEDGAARWWVATALVVVAAVLAGLLWWRPGPVDELLDRLRADPAPDPATEPARVEPPAGLDLPPLREPAPVARDVPGPAADGLDPAAVRTALRRPLSDRSLGPHVVAGVAALDGSPAVLAGDRDAAIPASTTKLLTSTAALEALGPDRRFATRVVSPQRGRITLVGGGDPLLERVPDPDAEVGDPPRADLRTLAQRTAEALRADGVRRVEVSYDASLFTGPASSPTWEADYLPDGVVSPISALWADRGVRPDGVRASDPALEAARSFADALREAGVRVTGAVRSRPAPGGADEVARVAGMPVDRLVEHLVETSDNEVAEVLAHQVGLEVEGEGSFAAGARAVTATLDGLGIDLAGSELNDGSGLSRANRLTATALLDTLAVAGRPGRPELRAVLTGLPVAGFTGSLEFRFDTVDPVALGAARGKTGTLTGVSGLAGVVTAADGTVLLYSVVADRIPEARTAFAIRAIERAVTNLAACACGR